MNSGFIRLIHPTIRRTMSSEATFPVTASIRQKLTDAFQPTHLDVLNESHMHNV
jgi:stress-induced morphogen